MQIGFSFSHAVFLSLQLFDGNDADGPIGIGTAETGIAWSGLAYVW